MRQHTLLRVRIDDLSDDELRETFSHWLEQEKGKVVVTPNAEMLLLAHRDSIFLSHLNGADLSLPDAVSLRYATAALTDEHLEHRHTGVDSLGTIAQLCREQGKRLLLLGGDPGAADQAAKFFRTLGTDAHGIDPGEVLFENGQVQIPKAIEVVIQRLEPDVIAVALGQRKQEAFMVQYMDRFPSVSFMIGVGGALEMISGQKRRGPKWMRTIGLEFVWRVLIEPKRAGRIIRASVVFPIVVAIAAIKQKRFIKALGSVFPEIFRQLTHR